MFFPFVTATARGENSTVEGALGAPERFARRLAMAYRGDDLDLRTPRTWTAGPGDVAGWSNPDLSVNGSHDRFGEPHAPIWVDETVLACCNQAFGMAQAHGAAEVRLEHLLNAFTRNEAAAEVLEDHSIRVMGLRRDTAAAIAGDGSVGEAETPGGPRRCDDLEDVLRRAATLAYRRASPAGVEDVLLVLSEGEFGPQGQGSLGRNLQRSLREPPALSRVLPNAYETPVPGAYDFRDRVRSAHAGPYFTGLSRQAARRDASDPLAASGRPEQPMLIEVLDRIRRLELAVREQKPVGQAGNPALIERFTRLEASMQNGLEDAAREWAGMSERLGAIESGLTHDRGAPELAAIGGRLDIIEEALLCRDADTQREVGERLGGIETALGTGRGEAAREAGRVIEVMENAVARPLRTLEKAHENSIGQVTQLRETVDLWRRDSAGRIDVFTARLGRVEQSAARCFALLEQLTPAISTVHRLTVDRHHWRNRLSFWIFGTNDWVAASWPAQASRVDEALYTAEAREPY